MQDVTDQEFESYIAEALDSLPEKYVAGLENVIITFEDEPSEEQRAASQLRPYQSLYGLFEGVPRTQRLGHLSMPDKITIFKLPMAYASGSLDDLKEEVRHTLWHEIAHYYGLDHADIDRLEGQGR